MTFHPWTTEFKKSVAKLGLESASLIHGAPEQLPRFVHDLEALELIYGPPDEILHYWQFRPYQKWMAGMAIKQDVFLGAEMGLGKTAATLYAIVQMLKTGFIKHVLIVAPLKVAEETWSAEIATIPSRLPDPPTPLTCTGVRLSAVVFWPSCPYPLSPQAQTVPSLRSATEPYWSAAIATTSSSTPMPPAPIT